VRKPTRTSFDKLYEEMVSEAKGKKKSFKDDKGKRSVYYGADDNEETTKMDFLPTSKLKDIAKDRIEDLDERKKKRKTKKKKKKKKKKKNPDYFKGTKKSNKQMDYEIGKCSVPNPPKSCYDEWTADKTYKKSKKRKRSKLRETIRQIIKEEYAQGSTMMSKGSFGSRVKKRQKRSFSGDPSDYPVPKNNDQPSSSTQNNTSQQTPQGQAGSQGKYSNKEVARNHIQFSEGYEVKVIDNGKKINITNMETNKSIKYSVKKSGAPLTVKSLKIVDTSGVASITASFGGIEKTALLKNIQKKQIITNFKNETPKFNVDGETVGGEQGTVTFIKR
jgi:hypothetical protein